MSDAATTPQVEDLTKQPEPEGSIRRRKVASVRIPAPLYAVVELTGENMDDLIQTIVDRGADDLRKMAVSVLKGGA
jgi:hypothetical protein